MLIGKVDWINGKTVLTNGKMMINPNIAEFHGNLGNLYFKTGRSEEAKKELEIAKGLFEARGREEDVKKEEEWLNSLK